MVNDECVEAYRNGGIDAVNRLLRKKYTGQDLVNALERLEKTGLWDILWHYQHRHPGPSRDSGAVRAYFGDDD